MASGEESPEEQERDQPAGVEQNPIVRLDGLFGWGLLIAFLNLFIAGGVSSHFGKSWGYLYCVGSYGLWLFCMGISACWIAIQSVAFMRRKRRERLQCTSKAT